MRIGKIARRINLMRLDLLEKFQREGDVFFGEWFFSNPARFIEGQILKVQLLIGNPAGPPRGAGFRTANQTLDALNFLAVDLSRLFMCQELIDVGLQGRSFRRRNFKKAIKF